jgi:branched-chain amino acid transport system permease protein
MVTKLRKQSYFFLGSLVVFSLLPVVLGDNRSIMHLLILGFIWGVVAAAWDLILGYVRVFSFGQIAFFALGGYTTAMLTLQLGISPGLGILAGGGVAAAIGLLIGLPCLRLKGIYVGMTTFALHLVLPTLIIAGEPLGTGGSWGLTGITSLYVGGYTFPKVDLVPWYYVAFGMFALFLFVIYKIINSSVGLAFVALRDSELFAKSLGINSYRYTLMAFGICAFITGIMGAFYVHYMGVIGPAIFKLEFFLLALVMIMLGGMARFPGAVIGAFVVVFLNNALLGVGWFRLVILGAIVVGVMIAMPGGLMQIPEAVNRLIGRTFGRRHVEKEASKV